MRTPRLARRLALEEVQAVPDGAGGFARGWVTLGVLWADLRAGAGRARTGGVVPVGRVPWRIVVPLAASGAPSRPRAGQRLREGERRFLIHAVAETGQGGAWLTCFCEEEEPA